MNQEKTRFREIEGKPKERTKHWEKNERKKHLKRHVFFSLL